MPGNGWPREINRWHNPPDAAPGCLGAVALAVVALATVVAAIAAAVL